MIEQVVADREVMPLAVKVNELQVDEFDALVLNLTQDVLGGFSHDDQRGGSRSEPALADRTDPAQPPFVAVVTKPKPRVAEPFLSDSRKPIPGLGFAGFVGPAYGQGALI